MARISGIDIPKEKRGVIALTYIYGVGKSRAQKILKKADVDEDKKVNEWSDDDTAKIRSVLGEKNILRCKVREYQFELFPVDLTDDVNLKMKTLDKKFIFRNKDKTYTNKSEIINEYIPQEEIKNLIQEDLPFIKAEEVKKSEKLNNNNWKTIKNNSLIEIVNNSFKIQSL